MRKPVNTRDIPFLLILFFTDGLFLEEERADKDIQLETW